MIPSGGARLCRALTLPRMKFRLDGVSPHRIISTHADLRISLREVRARQRNPRPLDGLEKHRVSALRLEEVVQEIFHLRLGWRRRRSSVRQRRQRASLLRRQLPRTLSFFGIARERWRPAGQSEVENWNSPAGRQRSREISIGRKPPARSPASNLPPPNRAGGFAIPPTSRRRWPRPELSRR